MSLPGFRRLSWGVAGFTLLVILWGYFLRISESGDGCGTDWPLCNGAVIPGTLPFSTLVELSHRITSGMVLVAVIGLAVAPRRPFPRGHTLRPGAWAYTMELLPGVALGAKVTRDPISPSTPAIPM